MRKKPFSMRSEFQVKLKQQLDTLEKLIFATVMNTKLSQAECIILEAEVELINAFRKLE